MPNTCCAANDAGPRPCCTARAISRSPQLEWDDFAPSADPRHAPAGTRRSVRRPRRCVDAKRPRDGDRDAGDHRRRCGLGLLLARFRGTRRARPARAARAHRPLLRGRLLLRRQAARSARGAPRDPHRAAGTETRRVLPNLGGGGDASAAPVTALWPDLLSGPDPGAAQFRFEQVPFDHALWILFSSGTTGLPKPIVHGHGGILLEIQKNAASISTCTPLIGCSSTRRRAGCCGTSSPVRRSRARCRCSTMATRRTRRRMPSGGSPQRRA